MKLIHPVFKACPEHAEGLLISGASAHANLRSSKDEQKWRLNRERAIAKCQPLPGLTQAAKAAERRVSGPMAEWLRRGLQILARRFDSGSGLHFIKHLAALRNGSVGLPIQRPDRRTYGGPSVRASVDGSVRDDESEQSNRDRGGALKVLFHGRLAEAIGPELEVNAPPGCSVAQLRERLVGEHPTIEQVLRNQRARACVGNALVHDNYVPRSGEMVEFLPPVSGG